MIHVFLFILPSQTIYDHYLIGFYVELDSKKMHWSVQRCNVAPMYNSLKEPRLFLDCFVQLLHTPRGKSTADLKNCTQVLCLNNCELVSTALLFIAMVDHQTVKTEGSFSQRTTFQNVLPVLPARKPKAW